MLSKKFFKKNFSVFGRLKEYIKNNTGMNLSSNMNPDSIKAEYEEIQKIYEKNLNKEKFVEYERDYRIDEREEAERKLIEELIQKIEKTEKTEEQRSLSLSIRYKTIWDKLDTYETNNEGKIIVPLIKEAPVFESYEEYNTWKENKKKELKEKIFKKLNPMEYYLTQEKGTERPFTGDYWDFNKVGVYSCKVCTQRIFSSTHKYHSKIGHATFWNFLPLTINFYADNLDFPTPTQAIYRVPFINSKPVKRLSCSHCDSHLGHVFEDGPAPFFKRLNVNSAAIEFCELPWFESPDEKRYRQQLAALVDTQKKILFENTKINRMQKDMPELFDYIDKHIVPVEKDLTNDKLVSKL